MLSLTEQSRIDILQSYYKLAIGSELSELEADRMEQILSLAEQDDNLSFWINEIDYLVACEFHLLDENHINSYQNHQAKLREYLETKLDTAPEQLDEILERRIKLLSVKLQKQLMYKGYYHGSIDGEVGPRTREALKIFQEDNNLSVNGCVSPTTLSILGIH